MGHRAFAPGRRAFSSSKCALSNRFSKLSSKLESPLGRWPLLVFKWTLKFDVPTADNKAEVATCHDMFSSNCSPGGAGKNLLPRSGTIRCCVKGIHVLKKQNL